MPRVSLALAALAALLSLLAVPASGASPYRLQAQALVAEMTQEEKLSLVHGWPGSYVGNVPAISRLGLPPLNLEDGPQGVSDGVKLVTAWPSALTVVASWDVGAMQEFASAMALEERMKGTNIHLAPMVNIARVPVGGRNFESFGEDPTLAAAMVVASVNGIQSQGIIATVKHFVDNNQELVRPRSRGPSRLSPRPHRTARSRARTCRSARSGRSTTRRSTRRCRRAWAP